MRLKQIISIVLLISILVSLATVNVTAETVTTYTVNGTGINVRSAPNTSGTKVCQVNSPQTVTCLGEVTGSEAEPGQGTKWYHIKTSDGKEGYIYAPYITVSTVIISSDFEKNLLNFPESYRESLKQLHITHPNWIFKPDNLPMTFEEAVNAEYGGDDGISKKAVPTNFGDIDISKQPKTLNADGSHKLVESGWYYASKFAIEFYSKPENYLNETYIFSFADQKYDEKTQTKDGLNSIIKNTFLANGYEGNTNAYIDDIFEAAKQSGLNPYVIAATIISEQGVNGTSGLISGTYTGYEGLYNFFNIGVSGDPKEKLGLEYAKKQNPQWNSRRAAIIGGAMYYSNNYVSRGQSTYYYKDWNYKVTPYYQHQYATNVKDAMNNGNRLSKGFGPASAITFLIPIFKNSSTNPTTPTNPTNPTSTVVKGDVNGDGKVNSIDAASIRKHILGLGSINITAHPGADTNGDNKINSIDAAYVRKCILGVK